MTVCMKLLEDEEANFMLHFVIDIEPMCVFFSHGLQIFAIGLHTAFQILLKGKKIFFPKHT